MTIPEHYYGLIATGFVIFLLIISILQIIFFKKIIVSYKMEIE